MAKPGQQIQSALMRDPTARPMPASSFRKTVAPPPRQVAQPQPARTSSPTPYDVVDNRNIGGRVIPNTPAGNRIGIGQFEQNQFNRPFQPLPVDNSMLQPYQPIPTPSSPFGQVGIGRFEQNQNPYQPTIQPQFGTGFPGGLTGGQLMNPGTQLPLNNTGTVGTGFYNPTQSQAMNQAAQIAQGATAGIGQGLKR